MPVLLFPHVAYFLVKAFVTVKNPSTGRITYEEVGVKWVKYDLWDPVQREHAHNYYLSLCPNVSQQDRDKVASEWADIRHAREAEEKKVEDKKKAEEAKKKAEEKKAKEKKAQADKAEEQERRIAAMLEESECVAMNIAKVEKGLKAAEGKTAKAAWMDVVMGD